MDDKTSHYKEIIDTATDLPTLSAVVHRLNEMVKSPTTSAQDVGELISKDIALTGKTLKLVNSSFYGFPKKINSITHAIVILGFNKVKNIALAASVLQTFDKKKAGSFDYYGFWEHSIACGIACETLAKVLKSNYVEDAFVAGLLHDVGKLLIVQFFKEEFTQIAELIDKQKMKIFEAENEILTINHSLVGMWIAEKWNFPESLCTAIRMHHNPLMARQHRDLVLLVHAADIFTRALGIGNGGDPYIPEMDKSVWDHLKLSTSMVDNLFAEIQIRVAKASDFFDLVKE